MEEMFIYQLSSCVVYTSISSVSDDMKDRMVKVKLKLQAYVKKKNILRIQADMVEIMNIPQTLRLQQRKKISTWNKRWEFIVDFKYYYEFKTKSFQMNDWNCKEMQGAIYTRKETIYWV